MSKSSCVQGCWDEAQKVLKLGKREYITFLFINKQRITKRSSKAGLKGRWRIQSMDATCGSCGPCKHPQMCLFRGCEWSAGCRGRRARPQARGRNMPDVSEEQQGHRESSEYWVTPSLMGPCKYLSSWSEWDGSHFEEAFEEDRV